MVLAKELTQPGVVAESHKKSLSQAIQGEDSRIVLQTRFQRPGITVREIMLFTNH